MSAQKEIIFTLKIDKNKVKAALNDLLNRPETKQVRDALIVFYLGLMNSTEIRVPESQIDRVIDFVMEGK